MCTRFDSEVNSHTSTRKLVTTLRHTYVRFCCQSQVQITYIACVRCILGTVQSHMIISQKGMRI